MKRGGGARPAVEAIIFDWGRTLYDSDSGDLVPRVPDLLARLVRRYRLAIVSLITGDYEGRLARRLALLRERDIARHFAVVLFGRDDKDGLYATALARLGLGARAVAVVDDRVVRGIRWGNRHGATTIWLRGGKFADELPDDETGRPTHTIGSITDLDELL
ncbi:MAG TPA: HAD hydrolase-like protein [Thermomicrobiales bacterium]|nr:HAD hydrolase-like protein [Thermomicrobiales bacterium]